MESVATGSAIGQSLLGSGKGVGQSGPFTVGNRPCDSCSGEWSSSTMSWSGFVWMQFS